MCTTKMPFQVTQRTIKDMINDAKVDIPVHQRPYVWLPRQAQAFLDTVMDEMPTLNLILYEEIVDGKLVRWLEDGQQRFMTVKKFFKGEFGDSVKWNNKKFDEFSQDEKTRFLNYPFTVTTMEDVPYQRRVALFQAIQEGVPLTNGQRFHAYAHSPIVVFAKSILSNPECVKVWGAPKDDAKKKNLANAVAIASGLAFQNIDAITTSYDILGKNGFLTKEFNQSDADERLVKLLSVYQRADELCPTTMTKKKPQFDAGKYSGYILYSMCIPDRNWETDKEMFAQFIARVRREKTAMSILAWKKPVTRNWNSGRWSQGVWNLDNMETVERNIGLAPSDDEESDLEDTE
jgi:hypothetical protein